MPTVTKVRELKSHADEQQVLCVRGTVTKLYDRKSGDGAKGPWSFQNFTLKDGEDLFPVTLNNRDALPKNYKDKLVQISCRQGDKGWTGVKVKLNEYDNKDGDKVSTLTLWVTKSAEIELLDEAVGKPDAAPPDGATGGSPVRQQLVDQKGTPKVLISKMANLMITCHGAALVVAKGIGIGAEETARIDAIRTTLFIQASYDKLYFQFAPLGGKDKAPAPPKAEPPPPPPPEPPEDDVPFN